MDLNKIDQTARLSQNNSMSLMVFKMVNGQHPDYATHLYYAINIFKVKEVLNVSDYALSQVPLENDCFKGMIEVRGDYIPVYDLGQWLGCSPFDHARSVYIVSEVNRKPIGFHVAHIEGVEEKNWREIVPSEEMADKVVNQTQIRDHLCLIVDVEKMINEVSGVALDQLAESEKLNQSEQKLVLYADDQKSMRSYLKMTLDNLGFSNLGFEDGQGIIDYFESGEQSPVFAVITDLEMPRVSGHTVIQYLKQGPLKDRPVFVHSSMTVGDSQRQAKELGADGFIGKISTDTLRNMLEQYL